MDAFKTMFSGTSGVLFALFLALVVLPCGVCGTVVTCTTGIGMAEMARMEAENE